MADSSSGALRYVPEVTFGTTPASALQIVEPTSEGFEGIKETKVSDKIVSTRRVKAIRGVGYESRGQIGNEVSYGTPLNDFLAGALMSTWASEDSVTDTSIAATATQFTDTGNGLGIFQVGQYVYVSGFSDSSIDGVYRVTAAAAGALDVFPAPTTTESAGQSVTIKSFLITQGTTLRSFSFEKEFTDLTNKFRNYLGCRVDTFGLSVAARDFAKYTVGFRGLRENKASSTIGTGGPTAAPTTDVMTSSTDVLRISESDTAYEVKEVNCQLANNLRTKAVVASADPSGIGAGRCDITGTIVLYLDDTNDALKTKFVDDVYGSLGFSMQDAAGNAYGFYLPSISFDSAPEPIAGNSQDIELTLGFTARNDPTLDELIMISRMAA